MSGLENLENIEESMKISPEQELAMLKAPMYQAQKNYDLMAEQTINKLYAQLLEKVGIISVQSKEIAELKQQLHTVPVEEPPIEITNPTPESKDE